VLDKILGSISCRRRPCQQAEQDVAIIRPSLSELYVADSLSANSTPHFQVNCNAASGTERSFTPTDAQMVTLAELVKAAVLEMIATHINMLIVSFQEGSVMEGILYPLSDRSWKHVHNKWKTRQAVAESIEKSGKNHNSGGISTPL